MERRLDDCGLLASDDEQIDIIGSYILRATAKSSLVKRAASALSICAVWSFCKL